MNERYRELTVMEQIAAHDKGMGHAEAQVMKDSFEDPVEFSKALQIMATKRKHYFLFDVETTGLPKSWQAPLKDFDNWPRIVQIAWLRYDAEGHELSRGNRIIKPEGYSIPKAASDIHGITTEIAIEQGRPAGSVFSEVYQEMKLVQVLVAHNINFDSKVLGSEFLRYCMPRIDPPLQRFCTMLSTVQFCDLPKHKWPKLVELHRKIFGEGFAGEHDAMADIEATARCFWELKFRGIIKV